MSRSYSYHRTKVISDVVTSAEQSVGSKSILIPNTAPSVATGVFMYNINITRANIDKTNNSKHFYDVNSGTVVVRTNSKDFVLTANDVITISGSYL